MHKNEQLKAAYLASELQQLKQQVNPHFPFNKTFILPRWQLLLRRLKNNKLLNTVHKLRYI